MSVADWDVFEEQKRPAPGWKPWLEVGSANTLFESATSPRQYEQQVVRLFTVGGSELSFAVVPAKPAGRWKLASARNVLVHWLTDESTLDFDCSPIRDFREERIQEARHATAELAADGHAETANRLNDLIDMANADWPHTDIPSSQAIQTLRRLLRRLRDLRPPDITLTDTGQLWTQWTSGDTQVALIIGAEGVPAIAALLPDLGSIGRAAHFNFYGSEDQVAGRLISDPLLRVALVR